jgi:hypothetical protein
MSVVLREAVVMLVGSETGAALGTDKHIMVWAAGDGIKVCFAILLQDFESTGNTPLGRVPCPAQNHVGPTPTVTRRPMSLVLDYCTIYYHLAFAVHSILFEVRHGHFVRHIPQSRQS